MLLALLSARGGEDTRETVEVLDRGRCQEHPGPPLRFRRLRTTPRLGASMWSSALEGHRAIALWIDRSPNAASRQGWGHGTEKRSTLAAVPLGSIVPEAIGTSL